MRKSRNIMALLSISIAFILFVSAPSTSEAYVLESTGKCSVSAYKRLDQVGPSYSGTSRNKAKQAYSNGITYMKKLKHNFKEYGCYRIFKRSPNIRNGLKKAVYSARTYIRVRYRPPANNLGMGVCIANKYVTIKGKVYCKTNSGSAGYYTD